jgi:hypothetical protein
VPNSIARSIDRSRLAIVRVDVMITRSIASSIELDRECTRVDSRARGAHCMRVRCTCMTGQGHAIATSSAKHYFRSMAWLGANSDARGLLADAAGGGLTGLLLPVSVAGGAARGVVPLTVAA